MAYIRFAVVTVLLGAVASYGQTRIALRDVSPKMSPVRVSGIVFMVNDFRNSARSYGVDGRFQNVSNKRIALVVVHFVSEKSNPPFLDLTYQEDYFFKNFIERESSEEFHTAPVS